MFARSETRRVGPRPTQIRRFLLALLVIVNSTFSAIAAARILFVFEGSRRVLFSKGLQHLAGDGFHGSPQNASPKSIPGRHARPTLVPNGLNALAARDQIGVGSLIEFRFPSLRTVRASLPHTALRLVVLPRRGLTDQLMGSCQVEQPMLGKEGILPADHSSSGARGPSRVHDLSDQRVCAGSNADAFVARN